jgi:hypothetical protein
MSSPLRGNVHMATDIAHYTDRSAILIRQSLVVSSEALAFSGLSQC